MFFQKTKCWIRYTLLLNFENRQQTTDFSNPQQSTPQSTEPIPLAGQQCPLAIINTRLRGNRSGAPTTPSRNTFVEFPDKPLPKQTHSRIAEEERELNERARGRENLQCQGAGGRREERKRERVESIKDPSLTA